MARTRPRVDAVLVETLRAALNPGVTVVNLRPDDFTRRLPLVAARTVGGGQNETMGVLHGRALHEIDVQCWAATREGADDLDDVVLSALLAARRSGAPAAGGRIVGLEFDQLGSEVRDADQPGRLFRWQAAYTIAIRPA